MRMTSTANRTKPTHSLATRIVLVVVPAALLAVGAFAMGTMQGDLRPAASDAEIARWSFATTVEIVAFSILTLALVLAVVESFAWRQGMRLKRAIISILLILGVGAFVFVVAWLIGLQFFALPTTM